ncbi:hypothetical protein CEXT_96382 [Caerostris extrusa]|uniref:CN hydrolase domain-containing protein n=1 Tax=Caerostris extrusa TaxID=172846 RepID=A0AAV4VYG7_CAEEX|nr:hypothetical protein CEXT_96382 [Caerostris extrusa]
MARSQALLFLILFVHSSCLFAKKDFYRAAVLELSQFTNISYPAADILRINLNIYDLAASTAAKHEADIIVFPESGLLPFEKPNREWLLDFIEDIPDPKKMLTNPCAEPDLFSDRPIITKLSCLARHNNIYVVANTADFKKCETDKNCDKDNSNCTVCPKDGHFFYNTNVVFNREGTLIAKYYKRHLYFEPEMNTPHKPEDAYFDTDFGNFSTFICFDLMFKEPVKAIGNLSVLNVAYPTYWFDHTPLIFFATPYQQAWAMANKVNLLAANGHHPQTGSLGSGIYSSSKGALIYTHNPDGRSKLLISNVPISPRDNTIDTNNLNPMRFFIENGTIVAAKGEEKPIFKKECLNTVLGDGKPGDYRCGPTNVDQYEFKKLQGNKGKITSCSNKLCCWLDYDSHSMDEDYYFGVSGKDLNFYDEFSFGTEACFIARCESYEGKSCTNFKLVSHTIFRKVEIRGNFTTKYILPFAIDSEMRLTNKDNWSFYESRIVYDNLNKKSSLLFFGVYGRLFEKDKDLYNQPDGAVRISCTGDWLIFGLLVSLSLFLFLKAYENGKYS